MPSLDLPGDDHEDVVVRINDHGKRTKLIFERLRTNDLRI